VNPLVPAKSVKDLVALIKANPGKYNFTGAGTGSPTHLIGEQFRLSLGLDLVHGRSPRQSQATRQSPSSGCGGARRASRVSACAEATRSEHAGGRDADECALTPR
jgi:Tripartite tricarboxylate transporter family receptor